MTEPIAVVATAGVIGLAVLGVVMVTPVAVVVLLAPPVEVGILVAFVEELLELVLSLELPEEDPEEGEPLPLPVALVGVVSVNVALGRVPFQTLAPLELSIFEPLAISTEADPALSTVKVTDATLCVPLTVEVDAQPISTLPLPPVCWAHRVKGPVKLMLSYCRFAE